MEEDKEIEEIKEIEELIKLGGILHAGEPSKENTIYIYDIDSSLAEKVKDTFIPYVKLKDDVICSINLIQWNQGYKSLLPTDIKELKKIIADTINWKANLMTKDFNGQDAAQEFYDSKMKKLKSLKKFETLINFIIAL